MQDIVQGVRKNSCTIFFNTLKLTIVPCEMRITGTKSNTMV